MAFERGFATHTEPMLRVLDSVQARLLWIDVIAQAEADDPLVDVDQVAVLAQQADSLLCQWHVKVVDAWRTPDYDRFLLWRQIYERRLKALAAVDNERLVVQIKAWICEGRLNLPRTVVLAGFNEYSPQMGELLGCLQGASVQLAELTGVSTERQANQPPAIEKIAVDSTAAQWQCAANWAQMQLTEHPEGRFAIVVPALQTEASLARRVLSRTLVGHGFNVAVAAPLSQWPLGRAMLNWLSVVVKFQTHGRITPMLAGQTMLGAGCVGSDSEAGARALIDAEWRRRAVIQVSHERWGAALMRLPLLAHAWESVQVIWQEKLGQTESWFVWANRFRETLVAIGFPGDVSQTSAAYQATRALDTLLSRLAGLDDLLSAPTMSQALNMLSRLARQTPFQPQRDRQARLDVLGLLEAEGGYWDGVWVMGVTDDVLPAMASPNPLIPLAALSQAQAPRATPAREYEWACSLFKALCGLAPRMIFSWPGRDGDKPIRPSPMIADLPAAPSDSWLSARDPSQALLAQQVWQDEAQVPLLPTERPRGGVAVLERQAINPCWAFFTYRLGVDGLSAHALLPNTASDRGSLLHKVMEEVWRTLGTQEALLEQRAGGGLSVLVRQSVQKHSARYLVDWPRGLKDLEVERSVRVIEAWLAFEAERPPFVVVECEQKHQLSIGPLGALSLSVSLDRLDRLPDGQRLLIDYKTGNHLPDPQKDWMGARLKHVQLLAYGQVLSEAGEAPDGLLWARLHASEVGLKGIAAAALDIDGVDVLSEMPWPEQMAQWQRQLAELGASFIRGDTTNVVWKTADVKYCQISALLRLYEESADESR
jgi:probable DNA repair protein